MGETARTAQDMVLVAARAAQVGTSTHQRAAMARTYGCDPTWLNDELDRGRVALPAFWIDRVPVTNAQYLAFVAATGARPPWPHGLFVAEQADHPVVGVRHAEAAAYAAWVGKRLPTAVEWEVAARPVQAGPYPWGSAWPGARMRPLSAAAPRWDLPGTAPVGEESTGRSAVGLDDLAGQVCEWTATERIHHGGPFHLLRGASWLHQDPLNHRTAAASWVGDGLHSPLVGFRCACDGTLTPGPVARLVPPDAPHATDLPVPASGSETGALHASYLSATSGTEHLHLLNWSRQFIQGPGERSRGFVLTGGALGPWPVCLFLAEALLWDDTQLLAGYHGAQPALQQRPGADRHPAYVLDFAVLRVVVTFIPGQDHLDITTAVTNKTGTTGRYRASSCISLTSHPHFYDCELLRTFQRTGDGRFVALRTLPRRGVCIRWIAPSDLSAHGGEPHLGVMAVLARDGRSVFAVARWEREAPVEVLGNPWLTCLHADAPLRVEGHATRITMQRLYALRGDLGDLRQRVERDVQRGALTPRADM